MERFQCIYNFRARKTSEKTYAKYITCGFRSGMSEVPLYRDTTLMWKLGWQAPVQRASGRVGVPLPPPPRACAPPPHPAHSGGNLVNSTTLYKKGFKSKTFSREIMAYQDEISESLCAPSTSCSPNRKCRLKDSRCHQFGDPVLLSTPKLMDLYRTPSMSTKKRGRDSKRDAPAGSGHHPLKYGTPIGPP